MVATIITRNVIFREGEKKNIQRTCRFSCSLSRHLASGRLDISSRLASLLAKACTTFVCPLLFQGLSNNG